MGGKGASRDHQSASKAAAAAAAHAAAKEQPSGGPGGTRGQQPDPASPRGGGAYRKPSEALGGGQVRGRGLRHANEMMSEMAMT